MALVVLAAVCAVAGAGFAVSSAARSRFSPDPAAPLAAGLCCLGLLALAAVMFLG